MPSSAVERTRFTTWTDWNHQPGLWIVTVLSLSYASLTLIVRHLIRRKFTSTDAILCAAYVFGAISYALMFAALQQGAGKAPTRLTADAYADSSNLLYTSIIFLLLACGTASCASLGQLEEIIIGRKDKRICWTSMAFCACSTIANPIIVSAGCSSTRSLDVHPAGCSALVSRWSATIVLIIINLLLPALLPFYLFRKLHTKVNRKVSIYVAFAFPLVNIPVAAVALRLYVRFNQVGSDGTGIVNFLCALEVLLGWSLICVTIPIGRPMALRFHTNGTLILSEYGSNVTPGRNTKTISEPPSKRAASVPYDNDFHIDRFMHSSSARRSSSVAPDPETMRGIRKTVTMEVENHDPISFIMKEQA
ncbi:uncharacterized protein MYCFIDRAFT_86519 [Pseudocercospora fijiensis CIRAD86]|uniref:Rhodopsin domain-containing protein n=1 Tax=Pseudocercospora fijiensis (strain CIRAD86) TaxID=383855 RepID=M3BCJ7_PSEFD|nr:uncharacterized protein MYCFIDRAFT_86519 [Pseudocercospora fijiensis CIRAD86]EME87002.1 hypothetical protein MYCFIDRAFT_86519 [Pseudocercospora fijiensis CIRAD86]